MGGGGAGRLGTGSVRAAGPEGASALSGDVVAEADGPFLASACCFFRLNSSSCTRGRDMQPQTSEARPVDVSAEQRRREQAASAVLELLRLGACFHRPLKVLKLPRLRHALSRAAQAPVTIGTLPTPTSKRSSALAGLHMLRSLVTAAHLAPAGFKPVRRARAHI